MSQSHKMAWPFLEGVNADEVPEYYDVITDPMGESIHVCLRKWKKSIQDFVPFFKRHSLCLWSINCSLIVCKWCPCPEW